VAVRNTKVELRIRNIEKYLNSFILHSSLRLDRIKKLLAALGEPQTRFPSIIIGGTAGKGSTSTMIASILTESGLKVGLYTSPHLSKLNERFKIDNKDISDKELIDLVNAIREFVTCESYFEILTSIAFLWFAKKKIDVAVLEVGMGGRWDATNVVNNKIAVLTNVGLDHTEFLGKSVNSQAWEKVAILKKEGTMVTGVTQSSVIKIVKNYAKAKSAKVIFFRILKKFNLKLLGLHQQANANLAAAAVKAFDPKIPAKAIRAGLLKAFIPGRLEVIKNIILDGAHNPIKMKALVASLKQLYPNGPKARQPRVGKKFITIFSAKKDKDIAKMLKILLPVTKKLIITKFTLSTDAGSFMAADPKLIASITRRLTSGKKIIVVPDPRQALKTAMKQFNNNNNFILVTGSLYLVGEIRSFI